MTSFIGGRKAYFLVWPRRIADRLKTNVACFCAGLGINIHKKLMSHEKSKKRVSHLRN